MAKNEEAKLTSFFSLQREDIECVARACRVERFKSGIASPITCVSRGSCRKVTRTKKIPPAQIVDSVLKAICSALKEVVEKLIAVDRQADTFKVTYATRVGKTIVYSVAVHTVSRHPSANYLCEMFCCSEATPNRKIPSRQLRARSSM